jgi:hypothetical protein
MLVPARITVRTTMSGRPSTTTARTTYFAVTWASYREAASGRIAAARCGLTPRASTRFNGAVAKGSVGVTGWYQDPAGLHDARWWSDGVPSALTRDGAVESNDPLPHDFVDDRLPQPLPEARTTTTDYEPGFWRKLADALFSV